MKGMLKGLLRCFVFVVIITCVTGPATLSSAAEPSISKW
jgi:hypothetical protein